MSKFRFVSFIKSHIHVIFCLSAIVIIMFFVSKYMYQIMLIQGDSMEPSYHNMSFVILEKNYNDISVGDVIAFRSEGLGLVCVKRVVALPEQSVVITDSSLFVDGVLSSLFPEGAFSYAGNLETEIILALDEYAVIGDNLEKSIDSRYDEVGFVNRDDVLGVVVD